MTSLGGGSSRFWRARRVFVTGATGLLGCCLVRRLVELEADVVALVRDRVAGAMFFEDGLDRQVTIVRGQLEDYLLLERCLTEYEIDTVFHLGAQTIVRIANQSPLSTFEANIRGSYNLLEAARRSAMMTRMVVASSDKAYGEQQELPYDEEMPLRGAHPYDVSKTCVDLLSSSYCSTYGVPLCITRCGNLFGPGDLNFNRIVPGTIRSILDGEPPIIRSDGTPVRDYLYVEDAALAYLLLAERMEAKELHGQAFNVSLEQPASVAAIVEKILEIMNRPDLRPVVQARAGHEIKAQYLSARKARAMLGWRPRFGLEEGLRKTIEWYVGRARDSALRLRDGSLSTGREESPS